MSLVEITISAFAHWGAWAVSCLRCPSVKTGLDRFQPFFLCHCGAGFGVVWPSEEMVYGIERLLLLRPDMTKQNWLPWETLVDLMVENAVHGIFAELPGEPSLIVEPERIRVDTLPATFRRELKAIA